MTDLLERQSSITWARDEVILSDLSDGALRLYLTLGTFSNRAGRSWPSRKALAEAMRCSLATVDRRVAELTEAGLLRLEHRRDPAGDLTSNLWILLDYPQASSPVMRGGLTGDGTGSRASDAGNNYQLEQQQKSSPAMRTQADRPAPNGADRPTGTANPTRTAADIQADLDRARAEQAPPERAAEGLAAAFTALGRPRPRKDLD